MGGDVSSSSPGGRRFGGPKIISHDSSVLGHGKVGISLFGAKKSQPALSRQRRIHSVCGDCCQAKAPKHPNSILLAKIALRYQQQGAQHMLLSRVCSWTSGRKLDRLRVGRKKLSNALPVEVVWVDC